jgi:ABC-type lipopolysaccharide export system ATPase subunit
LEKEFGPSQGYDLIEPLGLRPFLDHTPFEMSGGEERKAEIALAMARNPICLLADEPLNGIAPRDQEVVSSALRDLARAGTAVLVTGHEVRALLEMSDEVVWMVSGTTHGLGTPAEAKSHDQFRREYLGSVFHA